MAESEVTVPARELLFCLRLIKREAIKVDVAGTLKEDEMLMKLIKQPIP